MVDEAASGIDTETEPLIQRPLDRLAADRTTFVDRGTREESLDRDGRYANRWRVQIGELHEEFVQRSVERVVADPSR